MPTVHHRATDRTTLPHSKNVLGVSYQNLDRIADIEMTAPTSASISSFPSEFQRLDGAVLDHILQHLSAADLARLSMVSQAMYGCVQQPALWRRRVEASSQVAACREVWQMRGWRLSDLGSILAVEPSEVDQVFNRVNNGSFWHLCALMHQGLGAGLCFAGACFPPCPTAWLMTTGASACLGAMSINAFSTISAVKSNWRSRQAAAASIAFDRSRDDAARTLLEMDEIRLSGGHTTSSQDAAHASSLRIYASNLYRYNVTSAVAMALGGSHVDVLENVLPRMDAATRLDSLAPAAVLSSALIALIRAKKYATADLLIKRGASTAVASTQGLQPAALVQKQMQAAARAGRWGVLEDLLVLSEVRQLAFGRLAPEYQGPDNRHPRVVAVLEDALDHVHDGEDAAALCRLLSPTAHPRRERRATLLSDAIISGRIPVAVALWGAGARLDAGSGGNRARGAAEDQMRRLTAAGQWSEAHRVGRLVART